jgi:hypothetical protein
VCWRGREREGESERERETEERGRGREGEKGEREREETEAETKKGCNTFPLPSHPLSFYLLEQPFSIFLLPSVDLILDV